MELIGKVNIAMGTDTMRRIGADQGLVIRVTMEIMDGGMVCLALRVVEHLSSGILRNHLVPSRGETRSLMSIIKKIGKRRTDRSQERGVSLTYPKILPRSSNSC